MITLNKFIIKKKLAKQLLDTLVIDNIKAERKYSIEKRNDDYILRSYKRDNYDIINPQLKLSIKSDNDHSILECFVVISNIKFIIIVLFSISLIVLLIYSAYKSYINSLTINNKYQYMKSLFLTVGIIAYNAFVIYSVKNTKTYFINMINMNRDKYVVNNYCVKCNRIENNLTEGKCSKCGTKLTTIS